MRTTLLLPISVAAIFIACTLPSNPSKETVDYLRQLPARNVNTDNSAPRSYQMITDHYNYDLHNNFLGKQRIAGTITYEGDSAQWTDVYFTHAKTEKADYPVGRKINHIQNFKYRPDEKIISADFFKEHLPKADPLTMNLIWDALAFEVLAFGCWDSLTLNKEFRAETINQNMQIANIGTFENKDTRLTWLGITEIDGKICAIIKYTVMNNPLKLNYESLTMNGRSHYWGEIYVSLEDMQIQSATLMEDVLTDVKHAGEEKNQIGYTVRTISLRRILPLP